MEKMIDKYFVDLKHEVGKGSFANVYKGKNTETNTDVAVKVVSKELLNS